MYKYFCVYSYISKLQSPSKYFPFDEIHISIHFFHCSKQFLNSSILMPFSASAVFCFTYSTPAKCFPLRKIFIWGNKKKSLGERDQVNKEDGAWGSCCFGQILVNTQQGVDRYAHKSPIIKWANSLKESSKKVTEAKHSLSQQHQLVQ